MHPDARQFLAKMLSLFAAILMSVSFFAFLSIPYHLGGHLGEPRLAQTLVSPMATSADDAG